MNKEQFENLEGGVTRAVGRARTTAEGRARAMVAGEQGQNPGQEQSNQGKQVRFGEEEQLG